MGTRLCSFITTFYFTPFVISFKIEIKTKFFLQLKRQFKWLSNTTEQRLQKEGNRTLLKKKNNGYSMDGSFGTKIKHC